MQQHGEVCLQHVGAFKCFKRLTVAGQLKSLSDCKVTVINCSPGIPATEKKDNRKIQKE